uniref:Uncharacterized protein n=1 Tax=Knipowitschia caucasica TaxID=637954 RepID=A0AAV2JYL4_KNICA
MGPVSTSPTKTRPSQKRFEREKGRTEKRKRSEAAAALLSLQKQDTPVTDEVTTSDTGEANESETDVATASSEQSTDPQPDDTLLMKQMREELQRLTTETMLLKEKLKGMVLTPDTLRGNDAKVKHYTGVTYDILMTLYRFVEASIPHSASSRLTKFEKLMMVLMKLRLNLSQ